MRQSKVLLTLALFFIQTTKCMSSTKKSILIIPLYSESKTVRQEEYLLCLNKNLKNNFIERIHIIYDTSSSNNNDLFLDRLETFARTHYKKIEISLTHGRQTYGDVFRIANSLYPERSIIVSNADIYFDNSLSLLFDINFSNKVFALTRWELSLKKSPQLMRDPTGFPAVYSQDVWIFKSPIAFFPGHSITMGVIACDHKLSYELLKAGYDIFNPCLDIKCYHVHYSNIHNCKLESVPFAYSVYVPWCRINDIKEQTSIWATE